MKRRYTQAAPFGPGGPKAVPSTKTATKNEKNRKSSRRTCRQQARKDPKTVLSDKPAMGKPAAAGRNGSATGDSPYENGHRTGRSCAPHIGGTGGSRTLVQTRNPKAFYTLILRLILLPQPGRRRPSYGPSLLIFANRYRHPIRYFRLNDTPVPSATERSFGGVLVRQPPWTAGLSHFTL